jgi:hypothetical protein
MCAGAPIRRHLAHTVIGTPEIEPEVAIAHTLPADAELATFVEAARRDRPAAWAAVERLQRICRTHAPLTPEGSAHAVDVLCRIERQPVAPDSGEFGVPL